MVELIVKFFVENPLIVEGLRDGSLRRFGGVVRDAAGKIVHHLIESPGASEALMNTLNPILRTSQVSAAASVLNLGVSVAGFAYMGYKLNQLQKSMSTMQELMTAGFGKADAKLDGLSNQLGYILILAEENAHEQLRIKESLAELHRTVLVIELAELQSWLDQLSRFPDDSQKEAIRVASKVRRTLSDQALRTTPQLEANTMLVADISIRGWAVAVATEANLLMSMGRHRDARELIENEHPRFASLAENWANALLADQRPQLQTAFRFNTSRFRSFITPERVERIAYLHKPDRGLSEVRRSRVSKEAEVELEMSHSAALGDNWLRRQLVVAEYLDGLSELSNRLETLGYFARECEVRNLSSSRDILPGPDRAPGVYLLDASA